MQRTGAGILTPAPYDMQAGFEPPRTHDRPESPNCHARKSDRPPPDWPGLPDRHAYPTSWFGSSQSSSGKALPDADDGPWLPCRSRTRPGRRCGRDTSAGCSPRCGHRQGRTGADGGIRAGCAPDTVDPARPRSGIGLRRAHARHAGRPRGCGARRASRARVSVFRLREALAGSLRPREATGLEPFELLGDGLLDDRGQIAVRPSGAHQGRSRSSLSWNSALAVNCTLYRPGDRGWTTAGDTGEGTRRRRRRRRQVRQLRPDGVRAPARPDGVRASGLDRARASDLLRGSERREGQPWAASFSREACAPPPERPDGARSRRSAPRSDAWTGGWLVPEARPCSRV